MSFFDRLKSFDGAFPWVPGKGSPFEPMLKADLKAQLKSPEGRKAYEKATLPLQAAFAGGDLSQIDTPMSGALRWFLHEYNNRLVYHERQLPSSFNVLEAFFELDPSVALFSLRKEKEHQIDLALFLDWVASRGVPEPASLVLEAFEVGIVHSFEFFEPVEGVRVSADSTDYVVRGVSIIRHDNELIFLAETGRRDDLGARTAEIEGKIGTEIPAVKGGRVGPDPDLKPEAVSLDGHPDRWRVLIATRIDFASKTEGVRYLFFDNGHSYGVTTDDPLLFRNAAAMHGKAHAEALRREFIPRLEAHAELYELLKTLACLPACFGALEQSVVRTSRRTQIDSLRTYRFGKKLLEHLPARYKAESLPVHRLPGRPPFEPDGYISVHEGYKPEVGGFWISDSDSKRRWVSTGGGQSAKLRSPHPSAAVLGRGKDAVPEGEVIFVWRSAKMPHDAFRICAAASVHAMIEAVGGSSVLVSQWAVKDARAGLDTILKSLGGAVVDADTGLVQAPVLTLAQAIEGAIRPGARPRGRALCEAIAGGLDAIATTEAGTYVLRNVKHDELVEALIEFARQLPGGQQPWGDCVQSLRDRGIDAHWPLVALGAQVKSNGDFKVANDGSFRRSVFAQIQEARLTTIVQLLLLLGADLTSASNKQKSRILLGELNNSTDQFVLVVSAEKVAGLWNWYLQRKR